MADFLKNLKESLEKGAPNEEIINIHYEILKTADVLDKVKKSEKIDDTLYLNAIKDFVQPITGVTKENIIFSSEKAEETMKIFGEDLKKREVIEMNTLQIKLLMEDSAKLQQQITKNSELIEYLNFEMNKV
jgi:hypothetical protein